MPRIWHKGAGECGSGPLLARNTEPPLAETVAEILEAYRSGAARPEDIVARSYARIRAHDDPAIFISLRDEAELLAEARVAAGRQNIAAALRNSGRR
jgi:allophanate hydrolase